MAARSTGSGAASPLRPVPIQELRAHCEGHRWTVAQHLDGLASLTPVRGELRAVHRGALLEVNGEAETIVSLCCDRCLQRYNHPLRFRTRELLWLRQGSADGAPARAAEAGQGRTGPSDADEAVLDIALGELAAAGGEGGVGASLEACGEEIDPGGCFDPGHWTFEQLSLQLPLVNRCGPDCAGPASWGHGQPVVDPRWAALTALQPPAAGQAEAPA